MLKILYSDNMLCLCVTPQLVKLQIKKRNLVCYVQGGYRHLLFSERVKVAIADGPLKRVARCDTRGHDNGVRNGLSKLRMMAQ